MTDHLMGIFLKYDQLCFLEIAETNKNIFDGQIEHKKYSDLAKTNCNVFKNLNMAILVLLDLFRNSAGQPILLVLLRLSKQKSILIA